MSLYCIYLSLAVSSETYIFIALQFCLFQDVIQLELNSTAIFQIIQYWLFSLSNVLSSIFNVFVVSHLISLYHLIILHCMNVSQFIHSVFQVSSPSLGNYKQNFYKYFYASFVQFSTRVESTTKEYIIRLYGKNIFIFMVFYQTVFHSGGIIFHYHKQ